MKLTIIVPVFNEEKTLLKIIQKVIDVQLPNRITKEIIIIDDHSRDTSWKICQQIKRKNTKIIKIFQNPINLGKGAAVRHGIAKSTGKIILIQDADLELNPRIYPHLIAPILKKETRVVYGSRFIKPIHQIPLRIKLTNQLLTIVTNFLFISHLSDMETCYKVFLKDILDVSRLRCVGFDFEPEITATFLKAGERIIDVPVDYKPRNHAQGKKMRLKDGVDALAALITVRFFK